MKENYNLGAWIEADQSVNVKLKLIINVSKLVILIGMLKRH